MEHDRNEVVGRGVNLDAAVQKAEVLAAAANISRSYLAQSLNQAANEAEAEAKTDAKNQVPQDRKKPLNKNRTEFAGITPAIKKQRNN